MLLDTANPYSLKWSKRDRLVQHWNHLVAEGPKYILERIAARKHYRRLAQEQRDRAAAAAASPEDAFAYRVERVTEVSNAAERRYVPQPLDAEVILVKSDIHVATTGGIGYPLHESNGWRELIAPGKLAILHVQSSHLDMVTAPYAPQTARQTAAGLALLRSKLALPA